MDGGVVLPLNIIINIFRWLPSSLSYRASYQIVIAPNCPKLCSVCSIPRVQQMVIKKTNEEWLVELELHCVYLFQTFWTHNFLRRPLSECQWCLVSGDRMPETWRTSSRSRGKGVYQGGLSLVAETCNVLWLVNTVWALIVPWRWRSGGQWMLMKGVNTLLLWTESILALQFANFIVITDQCLNEVKLKRVCCDT